MSAQLRTLFRDLDVRGRPGDGLTEVFCERLGRGLGTFARREGLPRAAFVVGRDGGEASGRLRDGLVRGLVLSGQRVLDVGVVDARRHEFALVHLQAEGGVYVSRAGAGEVGELEEPSPGSSSSCVELLLGGGPLVGEALRALAEVVLGEDHAAGTGSLTLVDVDDAFRAAERTGHVPGLGRDTQVI